MFRRNALALLLSLYLTNSYSTTPIDSLKAELKQMQRTYQVHNDFLKTEMKQLQRTYQVRNDSLSRELQFYKVKESYYSDKLAEQTGIFSLIVTGLLALAALVNWGFIKQRTDSVRKDVENIVQESTKKIEDLESTLVTSFFTLMIVQAKVLFNNTDSYLRDKRFADAIEEAIRSMTLFLTAYRLMKDSPRDERDDEFIESLDIESLVKRLINKAKAATLNLQKEINEAEKIPSSYRNSYIFRLNDMQNELSIDDLIAQNTKPNTRQLFYDFRATLSLLIKSIEKKNK